MRKTLIVVLALALALGVAAAAVAAETATNTVTVTVPSYRFITAPETATVAFATGNLVSVDPVTADSEIIRIHYGHNYTVQQKITAIVKPGDGWNPPVKIGLTVNSGLILIDTNGDAATLAVTILDTIPRGAGHVDVTYTASMAGDLTVAYGSYVTTVTYTITD